MVKRIKKALALLLVLATLGTLIVGCAPSGEASLEADIRSVPAVQQQLRIRFSAENARFRSKLSADNITLGGAFAQMNATVETVKNGSAELLLQGDIVRNEQLGGYEDGIVCFDAGAFSDKTLSLSTSVAVIAPDIGMDESSLRYENGVLRLTLTTTGYLLSDTLAASDVSVEWLTVQSASVGENDTIALALSCDAATLDEAVARLRDRQIRIRAAALGAKEDAVVRASLPCADFFVASTLLDEVDEDTLRLAFSLCANNGTFRSDFSADMISLSGDLENANMTAAYLQDGVATVEVRFPMSQVEDIETISALVCLSEGALYNSWGTPSGEEVCYLSNILLHPPLSGSFQSYYQTAATFCGKVSTSPLTKAFATVCPVAGQAVTLLTAGVSASYDISKLCGLVGGQSEFSVISQSLNEINSHLNEQDKLLKEILAAVYDTQNELFRNEVNNFNVQLNALNAYAQSVATYIRIAQEKLMTDYPAPNGSLEDISEKLLAAYSDGVSDEQLLTKLTADEQEAVTAWKEYYAELFDRLTKAEAEGGTRGNIYRGYEETRKKLYAQIELVCNELSTGENSPLYSYDKLCEFVYLIDVNALPAREAYRASALAALECAMSIATLEGTTVRDKDGNLDTSIELLNLYNKFYFPAVESLEKSAATRMYSGDRFQFYASGNNGKAVTFGKIGFDYTIKKMSKSEKKSLEKKAKSYFSALKKNMPIYVGDHATEDMKKRLSSLGYDTDTDVSALIAQEALIAENYIGKTFNKYQYFLADFDSVSFKWAKRIVRTNPDPLSFDYTTDGDVLIVVFNKCHVLNLETGKSAYYEALNYDFFGTNEVLMKDIFNQDCRYNMDRTYLYTFFYDFSY